MLRKIYSTKLNVIANFAGSIWTAIFSIIFVPLYLPYIGIEAYGLIGFFTSIQSFIILLDFGISPTFNRELARLSALEDQSQSMHDLKRTLEIPNWISACLIALIFSILSPLLATYWIQPKTLTTSTITQALVMMSINIAMQYSVSFYTGGLMGLQRQLSLNVINIICSTLRSAGVFLVVAFLSPTIQAYLLWQGFVAIFQLIAVSLLLRQSLPPAPHKGTFQKEVLRKLWRFAAGISGITILGMILGQTDKIVLSRMLSLDNFGYYSLAVTISATAITIGVSAIVHSVYPQMSRLFSLGDEKTLSDYYHKVCQIVSVIMFPTVIVLAFFSYQILLVWTKDEKIASNAHLILTVLSIGTGLNCLMWMPLYLQLAHGWTRLALITNICSIVILVPLMIYGIFHYGAIGGAGGWLLLNALHFLITIQLVHRRILKNEQWRWYFHDVGLALISNISIVFISFYIFPENLSRIATLIWVGITWMLCLAVPSLIYSNTRNIIKTTIENYLKVVGKKRQTTKGY